MDAGNGPASIMAKNFKGTMSKRYTSIILFFTILSFSLFGANANKKVANIKDLVKYETITVEIPDDGANIHNVRIKPLIDLAKSFKDYDVYLVKGEEQTLLEKKGKLGNYNIYEIEGNSITLDIKFNGAEKTVYLVVLGIVGILIGILLIIVLIIVFVVRHGGKLPGILNKIGVKISQKIENKEQIFYDDSNEKTNKEDEKINKND